MFAVIRTGGKQYRVARDDILTVERLAAEAGETVQFNDVLMVRTESAVLVGDPLVGGAAVQAEVLAQERGDKVISFKKRRRKHGSQRRKGHRQHLTRVRVTDILAEGGENTGAKAATGTGKAGAVASGTTDAPARKAAAAEKAAEPAPAQEAAATAAVRPGNLLDAPQGEPDDLTRISGVGPALSKKLNENGVFHFWQIAAWGPEEVVWMDDQLSFKGRIERDNWIEQASALAAESE